MRPEHDTRRAIIREWMSLPKEKRRTGKQAETFAEEPELAANGDGQRRRLNVLQSYAESYAPGLDRSETRSDPEPPVRGYATLPKSQQPRAASFHITAAT